MTALKKYALLESPGRYFDGETARSRDVVVKFGDASLVVMNHDDMPITHWSLAGLRDLSEGDGLTLTPDYDSDERLSIDDATMIGAIRAVCPELKQSQPASRRIWTKVALWSAAAIGSVYLIVFHLAPALADRLAELIPPDAEVAMGEQMTDQFASLFTGGGEPRFCSTPAGDRALAEMTARLAGAAETHVPLTVRVLDSDVTNAFALPGGQIVLFNGLIEAADTPEEVAGVLAHEIGHVAARDPTRLTLRSAGTAGLLGLLLGDFTGATVTVALTEALLRSGYQREAESAADDYAARVLGDEGLPTVPFADFFIKLKKGSAEAPEFLSHLATHPDLIERSGKMRVADQVGDAAFRPVIDDQAWVALQSICKDDG